MNCILKKSVVCTVLIATAFAALGVAGGYFLGRGLAIHAARVRLDEYANHIQAIRDAAAAEDRALLATLNGSSLPLCSSAALQFFRAEIYKSKYMKDAGIVQDGNVMCSAVLGRPKRPLALPQPDVARPDGSRLYRNPALFRMNNEPAIMVQLGDAFVVFDNENVREMESPSMHYTGTTLDGLGHSRGRVLGEVSGANTAILTTEGWARAGNTLYVTRCSPRYFRCMTAYISIPAAIRGARVEVTTSTILGGLIGACLAVLWTLILRISRSPARQLRRAIARDALHLVYQPIVDLARRRIVGAEALVRWTDEQGVAVNPDDFIKIAEKHGFVGDITRLVTRRVLREFAETLRGRSDFRISINVAAADLSDPQFLFMLDEALNRAGVQARSLVVEITESSTARHDLALETIRQLRQKGHAVHIDDFGTGYSSLSYLHSLSVDAIKIDRSFTQAIGTDAVTVGIVPQILSMAETLNLYVVVEGIETHAQAEYFAVAGRGALAQGWLFGRPMSPDAFEKLLAEETKKSVASENVPVEACQTIHAA
jgi:sensor c-di-GMP phosphodiesterase-like protein